MKKLFKRFIIFFALILILLASILYFYLPPMTGFASKTVCSCLFVTGRSLESIRNEELTVYPFLPDADIQVLPDSSVITRILWNTSKAIYRKGLGCTLLKEQTEEVVRSQKFKLVSPPFFDPDTVSWPLGGKPNDISYTVSQERLNLILDSAFIETNSEKPIRTHAVVVVYNGEIIGERYAPGFDKSSRMMGWSMTKSIMNALIGILIREGKLNVNESAAIAEWQNDDRKNIKLENILQATSGLKWNESYFNPFSDFHMMFTYRDDKAKFERSRQVEFKPGEVFEYSSSSTNILSGILRQTVGDNEYYKFPYEKLFYKTGMLGAIMEPDASGTFVASSYCYATARDWARFGLLYLDDGYANGERILPEGWVEYSMTPSPAAKRGEYGAQWWLNAGEKNNPANRIYPDLPTDAFWADGFEEQYVMVIPSKNLVVVRLGVSHHGSPFEKMVKEIIECLPEN